MRCMNCGWDNHSNTTVCLKCGQPLRIPENYANSQDIFISKEGHGEAIPKPTVLNVSSNEEKCRKTVVFSTTNEEENHSTVVQPIIECPNCNYPVVGDFTSCPCCGTPLKRANISTNNEYKTIRVEEEVPSVSEEKMLCHECGSKIAITCSFCPNCGVRVHRPTIRRQIKNITETEPETKPHCSLTIIPEEEENILPERLNMKGTPSS